MTDHEDFTVEAARRAAERDELGTWVAEFLASPGSDNELLAHALTHPPRTWIGPVRLPLDQLHRLAGPPDHPVLVPVDEDYWRDDVEDLGDKVEDGWEPPPMVVTYRDGQPGARGRQPPGRGHPARRRGRGLGRRQLRQHRGARPLPRAGPARLTPSWSRSSARALAAAISGS